MASAKSSISYQVREHRLNNSGAGGIDRIYFAQKKAALCAAKTLGCFGEKVNLEMID